MSIRFPYTALSPLVTMTALAFVCSAPVFAQTDLEVAAGSIAKDIHADSDVEKLKGAKIFIAPFENRKVKKDDIQNVLMDMLSTEFINKKHFKVVERAQVDKALKELAFGESGFVDSASAKKLGKFVGAEYGLIGSISEVEGTTLISVRLVSVETGEAIVAAKASPGVAKGTTLVLVPPPGKKEDPMPAPAPGPDAIGKVAINPKDGAELVYVPAGEFEMGKEHIYTGTPVHTVFLDGYWIYKYPVTVAQYKKFSIETRRPAPPRPGWGWQDDHPIVNVSWDDAMAYCKWAGVTLPTEAQWEKAARGTDGRAFSWGMEFDNTKLWSSMKTQRSSTAPVHRETYTSESPYGCVDMGGNVCQWCLDWYAEDYYQVSPKKNPKGSEAGSRRVLRGGHWKMPYVNAQTPYWVSAIMRHSQEPTVASGEVGELNGFRCVATGQ